MGLYDTGCWILCFAVLDWLYLISGNALNISCGGRLSSSLEVGSGAAPPFIDSHGVLEARFLQPYGYGGIVRDVGPPDPRHSYCGGTPLGLVSTGDSSAYGIAENMVPQDVLAIRHVQVPYGSRTSRKNLSTDFIFFQHCSDSIHKQFVKYKCFVNNNALDEHGVALQRFAYQNTRSATMQQQQRWYHCCHFSLAPLFRASRHLSTWLQVDAALHFRLVVYRGRAGHRPGCCLDGGRGSRGSSSPHSVGAVRSQGRQQPERGLWRDGARHGDAGDRQVCAILERRRWPGRQGEVPPGGGGLLARAQ